MRRSALGLIFVSALTVACGGSDGGSDPTDPGPTPDFTMTVSPNALQLVLGSGVPAVATQPVPTDGAASEQAAAARSDVSFAVTIIRIGGFTGEVVVTVEGLPNGVTASALVLGGGQTSGLVTLTAGLSANAGTSNLTVRGSATGISAKTQALSLELVAPPQSGETFDIDFTSASASLVQGNNTALALDIDRSGGFTGEVSLSAASNPAGPGLSFDPVSTSGNSSTLTVTAGAGLTPGDYSITATGSGGDLQVTATIVLTVTASGGAGGGGGGDVSIRFCPENGLPDWLAHQDGTDPWERVLEGDPGEYSFDLDSGKGGIAFVSLDQSNNATLVVYYGSRDEIETLDSASCEIELGKTLMSSFAAVGAGQLATAYLGGASATVFGGFGPFDFTLENVADGPRDLVATLASPIALERILIRRGTNYLDGSTVSTVDFATDGFDPVEFNLTFMNTMGHSTFVGSSYLTRNASGASLTVPMPSGTSYYGVPASEQLDGDLHRIIASAFESTMSVTRLRGVGVYQKVAQDLNVEFGPPISNVTITFEATVPYVRPRVQFTIQDEYDRFWLTGFTGMGGNLAQIAMFEGYEPGSTFDRTLPDFSTVAGFDPSWGLQVEQMSYDVVATGWETPGGIAQPEITDGGVSHTASESGPIKP